MRTSRAKSASVKNVLPVPFEPLRLKMHHGGLGAGRDVANAQTHTSRLNRDAHLMHDLAVQHAVLKRLDHYDEVIWDKHIT